MRIEKRMTLALIVLALSLSPASFAHGDDDHGDKKKAVVTDAGMLARTARAGEYEVMLKHPAFEPLHEQAAKIFITSYATNEPVKDAAANLVIAVKGKAPVTVAAKSSARAGEYELTLPPLDSGVYGFSVVVKVGGVEQTASYGAVAVETPKPAAASGNPGAAMNLLFWLLGVLLLSGVGVTSYRVWHRRAILQPES